MKGSCHNSKTSNHIDIKLEPVIKLENKTGNAKKIWQKCHVRKLWRHCHFSYSWPILSNLVTFYLTKSENRTKKYLTQLSYYCFELEYSHATALSKGTIFDVKGWFFAKMLTLAKLWRSWYQNVYFLKLHMCLYLRTKFQISSIILMSFRQG